MTDQERARDVAQQLLRHSDNCDSRRFQTCDCHPEILAAAFAAIRAEQAATDAALERERDEALAQSRIDCAAYEALQADAVELARRIDTDAARIAELQARVKPLDEILTVTGDAEMDTAVICTPDYVLYRRDAWERESEMHHEWRTERDAARKHAAAPPMPQETER